VKSPVKIRTLALPVQQGHVASTQDGMDFVNTLDLHPTPHDHLSSADAALDWLAVHDLMHGTARDSLLREYEESPQRGRQMLGRLHRLRAAMRGVLEATVAGTPPAGQDLDEINRALRTHYVYELVPGRDGVTLEHRHQGDPVDGAMARLAESIARELIQGVRERLRICANEQCRWVFLDTSRTGRRKWCSMSTCGNRAKVARHRERQRSAGQRP
jgi:predicted RNA-binding Zn ribbon-like protein